MFSCVFLVLVISTVLFFSMPILILITYLIFSLITYIAYGFDKRAAENGNWRISEQTLHIFSLVGGWPGALIAQQNFRHKTQKQPFKLILWLTIFLNCVLFFWVLTPEGISKANIFSKSIIRLLH
nr:hypothetical protein BEI47_10510 [Aliivibrio fischeri]